MFITLRQEYVTGQIVSKDKGRNMQVAVNLLQPWLFYVHFVIDVFMWVICQSSYSFVNVALFSGYADRSRFCW